MTTTGALAPTCGPRTFGNPPILWRWYVVRCADNSLYCGITRGQAKGRLAEHNAGRGSKYVRSRRPAVLVMVEIIEGHAEALKKEAAFKKLSKKRKEAMVFEYVRDRGYKDAYQDQCEGCALASVGGSDPYASMKPKSDWRRPNYITEHDEAAYFLGYRDFANEAGWL